jgi:hypothetical protein
MNNPQGKKKYLPLLTANYGLLLFQTRCIILEEKMFTALRKRSAQKNEYQKQMIRREKMIKSTQQSNAMTLSMMAFNTQHNDEHHGAQH